MKLPGWPGNGATCKRLFGYCSSEETNDSRLQMTTTTNQHEITTTTTTNKIETMAPTTMSLKGANVIANQIENTQPVVPNEDNEIEQSQSTNKPLVDLPNPSSETAQQPEPIVVNQSSSIPAPSTSTEPPISEKPPATPPSPTPTLSTCEANLIEEGAVQRPAHGLSEEDVEESGLLLSKYKLGPLIFGLYSNFVLSLQVVAFLYLLPKICLPKFILVALHDLLDFINPFNTFP